MKNYTYEKFKYLIVGKEYFFFFKNYYCVGFVHTIEENLLHIKNGHFFNNFEFDEKPILPCEEMFLDTNEILHYAKT